MNPKHRLIVNINIDWRILLFLFTAFTLLGITFYSVAGKQGVENSTQAAPSNAQIFTGHYNLMGFEGIPVAGVYGSPPPVGDYTTTHCRFIDVPNIEYDQYYLQYPLHLPNAVTITEVSLHVADFNSNREISANLYKRPWNSRQAGTFLGFAYSTIGADGDLTINMTSNGAINEKVNNQTYEYWISVTPGNGSVPGQLCVYGIQVTYTYDGSLLPLIVRNN
jgi:hypothetical protein